MALAGRGGKEMWKRWILAPVLLAVVGCSGGAGEAAEPAAGKRIRYGKPRLLARLANRRVDESSGMAVSRRNEGVFWTHNDSGGRARLYAFNAKGRDLGTFAIPGAANYDWEDIASFSLDGKHYLLIGDIGDNSRRRSGYALYLVEEPLVEPGEKSQPRRARLVQTIRFTFAGGSRDGEGLAVDATSRTIFIATRTYRPKCEIFALPLPKEETDEVLQATRVATATIRIGNSMDISPDGRRAIIGTYNDAYEFVRQPDEKWEAAFARRPRVLKMPKRRKGESIAYGTDGKTLYLTSEGRPCPLWMVPVAQPLSVDKGDTK